MSGGSVQAQVLVGMAAPSMADRDRYAMAVLNTAIDDAGRRLFAEIRDRRGLAYSVGSSVVALGDTPAPGWHQRGVDPENVDLVTELIVAEVHRLRDVPLAAEELDAAKSYLEGRLCTGAGDESSAGAAVRRPGGARPARKPVAQSIAGVQAVTSADVQRVALAYLDVENLVPRGRRALSGGEGELSRPRR